jgi:aldose 1-epimerase
MVEMLAGYRYVKVFAPRDRDYIAFNPMTAPTSAPTIRRWLRPVEPARTFRAPFRIRDDALPRDAIRQETLT